MASSTAAEVKVCMTFGQEAWEPFYYQYKFEVPILTRGGLGFALDRKQESVETRRDDANGCRILVVTSRSGGQYPCVVESRVEIPHWASETSLNTVTTNEIGYIGTWQLGNKKVLVLDHVHKDAALGARHTVLVSLDIGTIMDRLQHLKATLLEDPEILGTIDALSDRFPPDVARRVVMTDKDSWWVMWKLGAIVGYAHHLGGDIMDAVLDDLDEFVGIDRARAIDLAERYNASNAGRHPQMLFPADSWTCIGKDPHHRQKCYVRTPYMSRFGLSPSDIRLGTYIPHSF